MAIARTFRALHTTLAAALDRAGLRRQAAALRALSDSVDPASFMRAAEIADSASEEALALAKEIRAADCSGQRIADVVYAAAASAMFAAIAGRSTSVFVFQGDKDAASLAAEACHLSEAAAADAAAVELL